MIGDEEKERGAKPLLDCQYLDYGFFLVLVGSGIMFSRVGGEIMAFFAKGTKVMFVSNKSKGTVIGPVTEGPKNVFKGYMVRTDDRQVIMCAPDEIVLVVERQ